MIFLPLGLLLLMMWSLRGLACATSDLLAPALRFAPRGETTPALVLREAMGAAAACAPQAQTIRAAISQALRLDSWRINLLRACFADLGLWLVLLVCGFFLQLNGLFVVAAAGWSLVIIALGYRPAWLRALTSAILFFGLFLVFGEAFLRFSSGWMSGETGDLAMLLADNRPVAVLVLTVAMTIVSGVSGLEFLAPALALGGLASGVLSLNGAVALMWGERVGLSVRLAIQSRKQIPSVRRLGNLLMISAIIALPLAFVTLGVARDALGPSGGRESLPLLIGNFITFTILTMIPFLAVASVLGHFSAQKTSDDLMERASLPQKWLREGAIGPFQVQVFKQGLRTRRSEIERLRRGFNDEEWMKVPAPVREASERELDHLEGMDSLFEAHLSSRWSFFGHQRD